MRYKIVTRKFIEDESRYSQWTTEFDNLVGFERAVRAAEAHFVLVGAYGRLDKDIADACATACGTWLDAKASGYRVLPSMSMHFHQRFGFMIVADSL